MEVWKPEDSFSRVDSHFLLCGSRVCLISAAQYTLSCVSYELVNYFVSNSHLITLVLRLQVHTTALAFFLLPGHEIQVFRLL